MSRLSPTFLILLGLTVLVAGCKNRSGSGSSSGGATGGGSNTQVEIDFAGPDDAAPTAGDTIAVTWPSATTNQGDPPSAMRYLVYRATQRSMADEELVLDATGQTSLSDTGLADDVVYFYRVVAIEPSGKRAEDTDPVSAYLPPIPAPPVDYATVVEPLWSTVPGRDGATVCTDCHRHDGQPNYGSLSLQTWERLMISTGTPEKPNGFIVEGKAKATGKLMLERMEMWPEAREAHRMWEFKKDLFLPEVQIWVDEGAHELPDLERPVFDFQDLRNQSRYYVVDHGDGTVTVNFPHAADPESEPYRGTVNDHLEYLVYAGEGPLSIDWRNPVATLARYNFPDDAPSWSVRFDWALPTGAFVVRARDFTGNVSLAERVLLLEGEGTTAQP